MNGSLNLDLAYVYKMAELGQQVQARYRCANQAGWGLYSVSHTLLLARVPAAPPRPVYTSSAGTTITIEVLPSGDNGGSPIEKHEVWAERDGGTLTEDTSYSGSGVAHTLPSLTTGSVYRIAVRSKNAEGYSEWSEYLSAAASPLPAAPVSLTKDQTKSSRTSIALQWPKVAASGQTAVTTGYLLWMAINTVGSSDFALAMNGTQRPEQNEFLVTGL